MCEHFCIFFGTDSCPSQGKGIPKEGHCKEFRINAKTHAEAEALVEADAKRHKRRIVRLSANVVAAANDEVD